MAADQSANEVHQQQLYFEFLSRLPQLLKEPLSQCLGVVYELYSGEQGSALQGLSLVVSA